ncbi:MAG: glycoside hydrolase family 97 N-terminal domain-containing protein, partial [Bacteroidales bacterium]|nr:glycoside hydrolase family 97 N-terminal domain-containing protein [Bacteroidales bacterium]
MKKLKTIAFILTFFFAVFNLQGQDYKVSSPNNHLSVSINLSEKILWTARYKGKVILENCPVSLTINNEPVGINPKITRMNTRFISREIRPVVPTRKALIMDSFNELSLKCKEGFAIVFRVYNHGVAYRFETSTEGEMKV